MARCGASDGIAGGFVRGANEKLPPRLGVRRESSRLRLSGIAYITGAGCRRHRHGGRLSLRRTLGLLGSRLLGSLLRRLLRQDASPPSWRSSSRSCVARPSWQPSSRPSWPDASQPCGLPCERSSSRPSWPDGAWRPSSWSPSWRSCAQSSSLPASWRRTCGSLLRGLLGRRFLGSFLRRLLGGLLRSFLHGHGMAPRQLTFGYWPSQNSTAGIGPAAYRRRAWCAGTDLVGGVGSPLMRTNPHRTIARPGAAIRGMRCRLVSWIVRSLSRGRVACVHRSDFPGRGLRCVARCPGSSTDSLPQVVSAGRNLITDFSSVNILRKLFPAAPRAAAAGVALDARNARPASRRCNAPRSSRVLRKCFFKSRFFPRRRVRRDRRKRDAATTRRLRDARIEAPRTAGK